MLLRLKLILHLKLLKNYYFLSDKNVIIVIRVEQNMFLKSKYFDNPTSNLKI